MTSASAVQHPDIFFIILGFVDSTTLASLRLTSTHINSLIIVHQHSICHSIALRTYHSFSLDFLPPPASVLSLNLGNLYIRTLLRIPRARLIADPPFLEDKDIFPTKQNNHLTHCTRGILVFWVLVDIQQSTTPDEAPPPTYKQHLLVKMARLLQSRGSALAAKSPSTRPSASSVT